MTVAPVSCDAVADCCDQVTTASRHAVQVHFLFRAMIVVAVDADRRRQLGSGDNRTFTHLQADAREQSSVKAAGRRRRETERCSALSPSRSRGEVFRW